MASAYASPPRSPLPQSGTNPSADAVFASLSQPPPPTLREVLSAYASQGQGDRDMLIALLKAKAAEDQRITSIATLQQQVIQMQMTLLGAQIQQNLSQPAATANQTGEQVPKSREDRRSPVSPSPPKRYRSNSPARAKAHPYSHSRSSSRTDRTAWTPRRSWDVSVSDERTTSDDGVSGVGH